MIVEHWVYELVALLCYLPALAGLEAVRRLPDASGNEQAVCVLILLSLSTLYILAYVVLGLVVPLFILGTLAVMLVISFLL